MADNPDRVTRQFTANAQSTDILQVRGAGPKKVHVHIREDVATWAATVDLEQKEPADSTWHVNQQFVIAAGAIQDVFIEVAGSWDFRLTTSAYTSGTGGAFLKE